MARALHDAGCELLGLEKLRAFIFRGERDVGLAARYLGSVTSDPERCRQAIADLACHLNAKRRQDRERNAMHTPYRNAPQEGESTEVWEHDRKCRIAWCRVNSDHRSIAEVAAELGVKEGTLTAMLDRGRVLSESGDWVSRRKKGLPKGKIDDRTPEQRVEQFREMMRNRRNKR